MSFMPESVNKKSSTLEEKKNWKPSMWRILDLTKILNVFLPSLLIDFIYLFIQKIYLFKKLI